MMIKQVKQWQYNLFKKISWSKKYGNNLNNIQENDIINVPEKNPMHLKFLVNKLFKFKIICFEMTH